MNLWRFESIYFMILLFTKMHPREMQSEIKVINKTIFKRMIVQDEFDRRITCIFMSMVL